MFLIIKVSLYSERWRWGGEVKLLLYEALYKSSVYLYFLILCIQINMKRNEI